MLIIFIFMLNGIHSKRIEGCEQIVPQSIHDACKFGDLELMPVSNISIINENNCNSLRNKNEFQSIPRVIRMPRCECPGFYTIFMLDPDVPDYKPGRFYNHLTLSGIDCKDLQVGSMNSATTTLRYQPPNPSMKSGVHRYMILIYRQKKSIRTSINKIANIQRSNWSLKKYLAEQTTELCGPVAGLQFRIQS